MAIQLFNSGDSGTTILNKLNGNINEMVTGMTYTSGQLALNLFDGGTITENIPYPANGVISGMASTTGLTTLQYVFDPGTFIIGGDIYTFAGGNITLSNGNPVLDRIDIIYINNTNTLSAHTGIAGATPVIPSLNAGEIGLKYVYINAGATGGTGETTVIGDFNSTPVTGEANAIPYFDAGGNLQSNAAKVGYNSGSDSANITVTGTIDIFADTQSNIGGDTLNLTSTNEAYLTSGTALYLTGTNGLFLTSNNVSLDSSAGDFIISAGETLGTGGDLNLFAEKNILLSAQGSAAGDITIQAEDGSVNIDGYTGVTITSTSDDISLNAGANDVNLTGSLINISGNIRSTSLSLSGTSTTIQSGSGGLSLQNNGAGANININNGNGNIRLNGTNNNIIGVDTTGLTLTSTSNMIINATSGVTFNNGIRFKSGDPQIVTETYSITDWNMTSTFTKNVSHTLSNNEVARITSLNVIIVGDNGQANNLNTITPVSGTQLAIGGDISAASTQFTLTIPSSDETVYIRAYQGTNYDATGTTRGYITVSYIPD